MKIYRFCCTILFAFIFSCALSGCFQYYFKAKPVIPVSAYPAAVEQAKQENRFFILHSGTKAYNITSLQVDQAKQQMELELGQIDSLHTLYVTKPQSRRYRAVKGQSRVLTEIHLYLKDTGSYSLNEPLTLPFARVSKIELLQKDKVRTITNHVFSTIGLTAGTFGVIIAIVALTKSSCPFVSGYNGNEFKLQGEIYGGAIYPSLKRNDYLPLQLKPLNGKLQVKISNELQERQYTDLAELWSIEHSPAIRIVPDEQGNIYSVSEGILPSTAAAMGKDVLMEVSGIDESYFSFNTEQENGISQLEVTFPKPADTKDGKLILHLKNSYWLDYIYGDLISHMGGYFNKWSKLQKNKSAEQLIRWKNEQAIPLSIEMKTSTGWKVVKTLTTVGPVAYREMVIPVDVSKAEKEQITLRFSSGFMFWELDRIAMDYTPSLAYAIHKLQPAAATDELGKDVRNVLLATDEHFLDQPVPGNVATISFDALPLKKEKITTYILHSCGYYEHVRSFKVMPDVKFLQAFKKPQALSKFSVQRYHEINSSLAKSK